MDRTRKRLSRKQHLVQPAQLHASDRSLDLSGADVVADSGEEEPRIEVRKVSDPAVAVRAIANPSVSTETTQVIGERRVVGHDHATLDCRDVVREVEAEGR